MRWLQRLLPWAEAETRRWTFVCGRCAVRSDVWEAGGIRYKAVGNPSTLLRCPKCGDRTFVRLEKDVGA